jgi:electron transport complex protein RnfC
MNSLLLTAIKSGRIWDFKGGIHPPEMKRQTSDIQLRRLPLSDRFIIPLQQHIGIEGDLLVNVGDHVKKGQPLTTGSAITGRNKALPVHAPTSGIISDIGDYTTAHPSGLTERCICLTADHQDSWIERNPVANFRDYSVQEIIDKVHLAGVAGLGGAGFPTATKLNGGLTKVEALIINAAECEPYITADDRLMQEHADDIVEGIDILRYVLCPVLTIIGIEDNKPHAIAALERALVNYPDIILRVIPTKYPSGGARQLTKILTGREVPYGKHSSTIGVLMQNVGTVYAVKRAIIDDEPLIERVTTLTGDGIKDRGNFWVPIGTPVQHLLTHCQFQSSSQQNMVIMGGPLMGFTLPHLDVPTVKITNCILTPSAQEISADAAEQNCIRCSQCAIACPAGLLPQQLYWFSRGKEHDKAREYHLFDCIECGACAYVCPSNIPLVQYYRQEKAEIRELDKNELLAQQAKKRFEAKQSRLEREKLARQQRHKDAAVKVDSQSSAEIEAALARVKAKKSIPTAAELTIHSIGNAQLPDNAHMAAARQARKELARQRKAEKNAAQSIVSPVADSRQQAVIDAIARAKARKQAQLSAVESGETAITPQQTDAASSPDAPKVSEAQDDRKAAVAQAIARAKARKQAQLSAAESAETVTAPQQTDAASPLDAPKVSEAQDDRKAAVAQAIARAKARKQAQLSAAESDETAITPQQTDAASSPDAPKVSEAQDDRKAAVAQAIARAKARKQASLMKKVDE